MPRITLYGHVQMDSGYDFGRIDPDYPDRLRVSALPSSDGQFGEDGQTYFSVRQSRFGVKSYFPTDAGEIFAQIEFDLEGSGSDKGKTTPRLRHAYGQLGQFGAGQYWSPFVDVDTYPNILESFGPVGLPWIRSPQVRWMPLKGETKVTVAVEKPGASGEGGDYQDLIELQDIDVRFRTPEFAASVRRDTGWGHFQAAGLLRRIWWDDLVDDDIDLSGDATGWGLNLSSRIKFGEKNAVKLNYVVGEGIENYMNDSTVDIGPEANPANPSRPIVGKALPVQGFTGYLEMYWGKWGAVGGWSIEEIDNVEGQTAAAYSGGQFATATLLYYPAKNALIGVEYQYGHRKNFEDDFTYDDNRLQVTFKYNFSFEPLGK